MPKDPVMLLSYVNMKLRDFYSDLDAFCDDNEASKEEITSKLETIGYIYDKGRNQFI